MLKIIVTLFLLIAGIHASSIEHPCEELRCKRPPDIPNDFPENNEELQLFCKPAIEWLECQLRYEECFNDDNHEGIQTGYRILGLLKDICSEDTLLHAAVVDNLKCMKKTVYDNRRYCTPREVSADHVERYISALTEEGLVPITENENDTHRLHQCIEVLSYAACNGLYLERECGAIAMEVYVEVAQRAGPGAMIEGCDDAFDVLPALIRLRKLEEEKEHEVAEVFRKKK